MDNLANGFLFITCYCGMLIALYAIIKTVMLAISGAKKESLERTKENGKK